MDKRQEEDLLSNQGLAQGHFKSSDVFIAIMGVTGAGKSTFVSTCAPDSGVQVGHTLQACTQEIGYYEMAWSKESTVWLIDTPGFDDTYRSDTDVLKELAGSLAALYGTGIKLSGITYLHQITENRLRGSAMRNLVMFRKLCGPDFYQNVILATTMWSKVEPTVGADREAGLIKDEDAWGSMKRQGSRVCRFDGSRESAMELVKSLSEKAPAVLTLQEELSNPDAELSATTAGQEVDGELGKKQRKAQREVEELKTDLRDAHEFHDEAMEAALKKARAEKEDHIAQLLQQQRDLKTSIETIFEEKAARMEEELRLERQKRHEMESEMEKERLVHQGSVSDLRTELTKLNKNPKARAAPGANKMGRWSVSFSLFDSLYWFDASSHDFGSPTKDIPEARLPYPNPNGNRCVAFGEHGSWFINYREFRDDKTFEEKSICSKNFESLYPEAYRHLFEDHANECPSCISLSTGGQHFVRTASGMSCKLPSSTKHKSLEYRTYQSIWLGQNGAFVAQRQSTNQSTNETVYEHKIHLEGIGFMNTMALNPVDRSQWAVLWRDGFTAYSKEQMSFEGLVYEDFCSVNFGTRWDNNAADNVGDAAEDTPMGLLLMKEGRRRLLMPWKRKDAKFAFREIIARDRT